MSRKPWTFVTNHGAVLAIVGSHSQMTAREIANRLSITERTVLRIIKDLESEGYVERERVGRENHYRVNRSQPMRRQDQRTSSVGALLEVLHFDE
ncbi:MAG: winged helix-turn-helix transcriptional regulator [Anaerolineales bacterium]